MSLNNFHKQTCCSNGRIVSPRYSISTAFSHKTNLHLNQITNRVECPTWLWEKIARDGEMLISYSNFGRGQIRERHIEKFRVTNYPRSLLLNNSPHEIRPIALLYFQLTLSSYKYSNLNEKYTDCTSERTRKREVTQAERWSDYCGTLNGIQLDGRILGDRRTTIGDVSARSACVCRYSLDRPAQTIS